MKSWYVSLFLGKLGDFEKLDLDYLQSCNNPSLTLCISKSGSSIAYLLHITTSSLSKTDISPLVRSTTEILCLSNCFSVFATKELPIPCYL